MASQISHLSATIIRSKNKILFISFNRKQACVNFNRSSFHANFKMFADILKLGSLKIFTKISVHHLVNCIL